MSRNPDRQLWLRPAWVLLLALTACATTPPSTATLDAASQRTALLELQTFAFSGRVAVKPQGVGSISVDWQQRQELAKVKLASLLGTGGMQLEYSPTSLVIATGSGDRLVGGDAEQLLIRELKFLPPFDALRFWVRGLSDPSSPATETLDATGLLATLSQQDWVVSYERRVGVDTLAGRMQLPAKLVAKHGELSLVLVVDRWRMK